eukprot:1370886-Amorphochlora_amoeboformis.AAC.1
MTLAINSPSWNGPDGFMSKNLAPSSLAGPWPSGARAGCPQSPKTRLQCESVVDVVYRQGDGSLITHYRVFALG